jgi:acyl-CoA synthetase (AMP-forming)/AMP-acid ligase II
VAAFVVPKGGRPIETDSLKSFLKSRLSSFKVPKEYVIVKEMPKSAAGKILKRDLKKSFLESGNK